MDNESSAKSQQLERIFEEQFRSTIAQEYHQTYLEQLRQRLQRWQSETTRKIDQFIDEKNEEISQFYDQYCQDFSDKYQDLNQQIENESLPSDINEQLKSFQLYCEVNYIENCLRLNIDTFSNDQIADNLQVEYDIDPNPTAEKTDKSLHSPVQERTAQATRLLSSTKRKSIEPLGSPDVEEKSVSPEFIIRKRTTEPTDSSYVVRRSISPEPIVRRKTSEPSDSPVEDETKKSPDFVIRRRTIEPADSSAPERRRSVSPEPAERERTIKPSDSPLQQRRSSSPESTNRRSMEPAESPIQQQRSEPSESPESTVRRTIEPTDSPIETRKIESPESVVIRRSREPSESNLQKRTDSIHSAQTSSRASPVSVPVSRRTPKDHSNGYVHTSRFLLKPQPSPSKEEPKILLRKSPAVTTTTTTTGNKTKQQSKTLPRMFIGQRDVLTPVLVGKDREVYNETEKITEYSIDSIPIPEDKHDQPTITNLDNDEMKLVHAYKVLIQEENDRRVSTSSSDHDDEDNDEEVDEELAYVNNRFHLKKFDQINYSTIMFRKCETDYNCVASSTRRNELVLYNSKLKVLIILQHDHLQQCRNRFYLYWPKNLSSTISDIIYCSSIDHFLISTWNTGHLYLFNRDLLSLTDLGNLTPKSPLRRIHCYQQALYCIVSNNYLFEYLFDQQYSSVSLQQKIHLFNPNDRSQEPVFHLLDVTCDENYLVILYSNEHDEIHLQSLHQQTKEFHRDLLIDIRQPINQSYIRIEATQSTGYYLYLNGSQQHLKSIDLVNYNKGKITSTIRRHTKPTNISFLNDQRLVILYEQPYFLSVHDLNTRQ